MSMDSTNTYRFGQMELALPQNWDVAFFKNTVGNKGLNAVNACVSADLLVRQCFEFRRKKLKSNKFTLYLFCAIERGQGYEANRQNSAWSCPSDFTK